jgi:hypothetical protein
METWHYYGCAPLEKGSNGSHLTVDKDYHIYAFLFSVILGEFRIELLKVSPVVMKADFVI